jgi:uncharacterized 2Fe-2S/4Fe-4S cluster protein (DUF4445 family)
MTIETVRIQLEPLSAVVEVPRGASLVSALSAHGVEFPCGGTGICGGCRVRVMAGSVAVRDPDLLVFSRKELDDGWRLACQARAETPLVLECGQWHMDVLTDNSNLLSTGKSGLGIAIDLGTTTIAAQMIDLATGEVHAIETNLNPQASFGSDVMSRSRATLSGADLTTVVRAARCQMIANLAGGREQEIVEVVLVGNTVMHHLFSGLDVEPLSHAPFQSAHLGVQCFHPCELGWALPTNCRIRFERCLGGFVGSDILAGIVAVGMCHSEDLLALIDLGTNGVMELSAHPRRRGLPLKRAPSEWECERLQAPSRACRSLKTRCSLPSLETLKPKAFAAVAWWMQWRWDCRAEGFCVPGASPTTQNSFR